MNRDKMAPRVAPSSATEMPPDLLPLLQALCLRHDIVPTPQLEWSRRMVSSLGKAFPRQNLIRLSAWLSVQQADETLLHELAHIAAASDGPERPHGSAWQRWATHLGAEPKGRSSLPPARAPEKKRGTLYWGLECPGCGLRLIRQRVLPGLYHRACGARRGRLTRTLRAPRRVAEAWAAVS